MSDILTIGDSLTAGLARSSGGVITCAALGGAVIAPDRQGTCKGNGQRNIGGWQPELANLTAVNVFNFGNSGELSAQILARLDREMNARDSGFVLILAGTNDAIRGPSVDVIAANLSSMVARVSARGRTPVIGTLPPLLGGRFAAVNARVIAINNKIKQLEGVEIADHYAALLERWSSNTSGDFIHLGVNGNTIVAREWADAIRRSLVEPTKPAAALVPTINLVL